jgi:hypothetical protein
MEKRLQQPLFGHLVVEPCGRPGCGRGSSCVHALAHPGAEVIELRPQGRDAAALLVASGRR